MRIRNLLLPFLLAIALPGHAQLRPKTLYEPAGDTLSRARRASMLGQPDAKPFHILVEISPRKGEPDDYAAAIEETWLSPLRWVRTVTTDQLVQKTVADNTGIHVSTKGDYFPEWLRNYVTALFDPVPENLQRRLANAPIEHGELANGMRSAPCQHVEFNLGAKPHEQVNFANVCFEQVGRLLELAQSPEYTMEFNDYAEFDRLQVARTLYGRGASPRSRLTGKVVVLEDVDIPPADVFVIPVGAAENDPLSTEILPTDVLLQLSGGLPRLRRPKDAKGHGSFTVWVDLDRSGEVREAYTLNSDDSGTAWDLAGQLIGMRWKPYVLNGTPVQCQGALVLSY